jgi:hypothetical protein
MPLTRSIWLNTHSVWWTRRKGEKGKRGKGEKGKRRVADYHGLLCSFSPPLLFLQQTGSNLTGATF